MPTVTVFNRGGNAVEAAGRVWPPRRPTTVTLDAQQVAAVRRHRRLEIRDAGDGLDRLTVDALRDRLAAADLPTGGRKAELIARLRGDTDA